MFVEVTRKVYVVYVGVNVSTSNISTFLLIRAEAAEVAKSLVSRT